MRDTLDKLISLIVMLRDFHLFWLYENDSHSHKILERINQKRTL